MSFLSPAATKHSPPVKPSLPPFSKACASGKAPARHLSPPSSTDRGDVPSLGRVAAAVCAPELPHAAQDGSRGDYSLLIITDRATTGRRRAVRSKPGVGALGAVSDSAAFWRVS